MNDSAERGGASGEAGAPDAGSSGRSGAAGSGGSRTIGGASHGGDAPAGGKSHGGSSGSSGVGGDTVVGGGGDGGDGGDGGGIGGEGVGGAGAGVGGAGEQGADLAIRQVVMENYVVGYPTQLNVYVENRGPLPSRGDIIIEDLPDAVLTLTQSPYNSDPWACQSSAETLVCRLAEPVPAGLQASLKLLVTASTEDGSPFENTVSVRSEADANVDNDRNTELLSVHRPVDLALTLDFPANASSATVTVQNVGDAPTFAQVVFSCSGFTDTLIVGASPDTDAWTCAVGGTASNGVGCVRSEPLPPGAATTVTLSVGSRAMSGGHLLCEVGTAGDLNDQNDAYGVEDGIRI